MDISITNLTTAQVDENFLVRIAQIVLQQEKSSVKAGVSIVLSGENFIKKLNYKYRGKNRVTDVLAFSLGKASFPLLKEGEDDLGEVVICLSEVKKNAKKFQTASEKELARVVIHGILHLLGYDHEQSEQEAMVMEEKERCYLENVKFQGSNIKSNPNIK